MLNVATTDIFIDVIKYPFTQLDLFLQLVTKDFRSQLLFNIDLANNPMLYWVPNSEM